MLVADRVMKSVAAIVVLLIQAEEFSPRDYAVIVVIRAAEAFAIEMPFIAGDAWNARCFVGHDPSPFHKSAVSTAYRELTIAR